METEKKVDIVFNKAKYDNTYDNGLNYKFSNLKSKLLNSKFNIK
jgi:hypothetical protein